MNRQLLVFVAFVVFAIAITWRTEDTRQDVRRVITANPCIQHGTDSKQCQRARNLFARTVTFKQACLIAKKANPNFRCQQRRQRRSLSRGVVGGGGSNPSGQDGGRSAPAPIDHPGRSDPEGNAKGHSKGPQGKAKGH